MRGISKFFPGVIALNSIDFSMIGGEVVILVGENGAGKSTLMKIIAGVHRHDEGTIFLEGKPVEFQNPAQAKSLGISVVYQEQALIPDLNAVENIFIGKEETYALSESVFAVLDRKTMYREAERVLRDTFEMTINLGCPVKELPLVERQIIEIVRAIIHNAKILILDEPTAALEDSERDHLFAFIKRIKSLGVGIIYCSHYIEECIEIGDRIIAIRDGRIAGELDKRNASINKVIKMMIGKSIAEQYPKQGVVSGESPVLRVNGISLTKNYDDIGFELYPGEILGIGGLAGCGKSAVARTLFGIYSPGKGSIILKDRCISGASTAEIVKNGLAFLPSDRKNEGLFLDQSVRYNISIANMGAIEKPWIRRNLEDFLVHEYIDKINIKTPSVDTVVRQLSGGNQQKAMIARWISIRPDVMVFEEPTRGIDINAKVEVYKLIGEFVFGGGAIILVSSEVQELEGICDRVIVMHNGSISSVLKHNEITKEKITYYSVATDEMESAI